MGPSDKISSGPASRGLLRLAPPHFLCYSEARRFLSGRGISLIDLASICPPVTRPNHSRRKLKGPPPPLLFRNCSFHEVLSPMNLQLLIPGDLRDNFSQLHIPKGLRPSATGQTTSLQN